jgi:hypothetical protein
VEVLACNDTFTGASIPFLVSGVSPNASDAATFQLTPTTVIASESNVTSSNATRFSYSQLGVPDALLNEAGGNDPFALIRNNFTASGLAILAADVSMIAWVSMVGGVAAHVVPDNSSCLGSVNSTAANVVARAIGQLVGSGPPLDTANATSLTESELNVALSLVGSCFGGEASPPPGAATALDSLVDTNLTIPILTAMNSARANASIGPVFKARAFVFAPWPSYGPSLSFSSDCWSRCDMLIDI